MGGRLSRYASDYIKLDVAYSTDRDFDKPSWRQLNRQIIEWELPTLVACTVWVVDTEDRRTLSKWHCRAQLGSRINNFLLAGVS